MGLESRQMLFKWIWAQDVWHIMDRRKKQERKKRSGPQKGSSWIYIWTCTYKSHVQNKCHWLNATRIPSAFSHFYTQLKGYNLSIFLQCSSTPFPFNVTFSHIHLNQLLILWTTSSQLGWFCPSANGQLAITQKFLFVIVGCWCFWHVADKCQGNF